MRELETRYVRSKAGCKYSSDSFSARQKGQGWGESEAIETKARILKPINSAGRTPINSERERLTRRTSKCSSCTTMKSEIESKISAHWRLDCVILVNRREFSNATDACTISACSKLRSPDISSRLISASARM